MKRFVILLALAVAANGACGGDDSGDDDDDVTPGIDSGTPGNPDAMPEEANPGFTRPTEVTKAYNEVDGEWVEVGDANWDCLNTPTDDVASTVAITITGTITDFQEGTPVANATVTAYGDVDFASPGLTTANGDADGNYSLVLPAGQTRVAYKTHAPDVGFDTYLLNQYNDPNDDAQSEDLNSVSYLTGNAIPAFVGVQRTEGTGVLAGAIRDCDGNEVANAVATVSSTAGTPEHLEGAVTFYFSAGSTSLPVRLTQQPTTNTDGLFVVLQLPPAATGYMQVWGFTADQDPATDELTLLAELGAPVIGDSVITASMEALRTE